LYFSVTVIITINLFDIFQLQSQLIGFQLLLQLLIQLLKVNTTYTSDYI